MDTPKPLASISCADVLIDFSVCCFGRAFGNGLREFHVEVGFDVGFKLGA